MWDKVRKRLHEVCDVFELFMAGAVACGIVVAILTLWPELIEYWNNRMSAGAFLGYLDAVFNVVIGIEFMKMLCKPSSANIIEVLIFLIARHMIVTSTTPSEDLLSVLSIGILFFFRRFMLITKPDKQHHVRNILGAIRPERLSECCESVDKEEKESGEYTSREEKAGCEYETRKLS